MSSDSSNDSSNESSDTYSEEDQDEEQEQLSIVSQESDEIEYDPQSKWYKCGTRVVYKQDFQDELFSGRVTQVNMYSSVIIIRRDGHYAEIDVLIDGKPIMLYLNFIRQIIGLRTNDNIGGLVASYLDDSVINIGDDVSALVQIGTVLRWVPGFWCKEVIDPDYFTPETRYRIGDAGYDVILPADHIRKV